MQKESGYFKAQTPLLACFTVRNFNFRIMHAEFSLLAVSNSREGRIGLDCVWVRTKSDTFSFQQATCFSTSTDENNSCSHSIYRQLKMLVSSLMVFGCLSCACLLVARTGHIDVVSVFA
ncbi:unnamed protein product [Periconia digitata]|uniref:Uncharacterized protein n=1 Tax=Periconia digitata TaxID=1303443 RepID=A0A9W4UQB7_9PLEO|nr:unnamed protein product [Periconia digitata]